MTVPAGHYADFQYEIYEAGLAGAAPRWPVDEPSLAALAVSVMSPQAAGYVQGDAGLGNTVRANREAFAGLRLLPRVLAAAFPRDHRTTVLGTDMPFPVIMAPVGVLRLVHPEAEVGAARAAADLGMTFVHSTASTTPMEEVAAAVGGPRGGASRWYQMYVPRSQELAASFLRRARASGHSAVVVTLDTTTRAWRPGDLNLGHLPFLHGHGIANYLADPVFRASLARPPEEDLPAAVAAWRSVAADPRIDWERVAWLREATDLPLVLKGVLHPDDARRAADEGVDGVVVSNHGGRQLDGAIAAVDALPAVVDAAGEQLTVMFDSGVRSGADAVKALALGARAVLLGRPWIWGLAVGGREGVVHALRSFLADYDVTLGLLGHRTPAELGRHDLA